ncbi:MAG: hypothetical protein ACM3SR_17870 [Ignavibacteriales bacterium]
MRQTEVVGANGGSPLLEATALGLIQTEIAVSGLANGIALSFSYL